VCFVPKIQSYTLRLCSSGRSTNSDGSQSVSGPGNAGQKKAQQISQAMKSYLERAKQFQEFMEKEEHEFDVGKRHLANIMSLDEDAMTQQDIDKAIEYLLPSGLTDSKARPLLKPPSEIIPQQKEAQFDMEGRPYHSLFYTGKPNYYQTLHDISVKHEILKARQAKKRVDPTQKLSLAGSVWVKQNNVEKKLREKLKEEEYSHLLRCVERLSAHTMAKQMEDYILQFRSPLSSSTAVLKVAEPTEDESGRLTIEAFGKRKNSEATVRVTTEGSGLVTINGQPMIDFFTDVYDGSRQQLLSPLALTCLLGEVDVEVTVSGPKSASTSKAGAIRLGMARALCSFVPMEVREQMRIAGMLSTDPRRKERKKFGQVGARKKFTWKKR